MNLRRKKEIAYELLMCQNRDMIFDQEELRNLFTSLIRTGITSGEARVFMADITGISADDITDITVLG